MVSFASLISLGCSKNLVDSEIMIPQLEQMGYSITQDLSNAQIIVVNTCGFLESAVQEAVDTILEVARHREKNRCTQLIVTGCMVQRYGRKLKALLPEVDLFLGTSHYDQLSRILEERSRGEGESLYIRRPDFLATSRLERKRCTPSYSAYLKVADGCSHRCTYCMIPRLRGPYRSRTLEDIQREAARLAAEGVKEINLIAQDITALGMDRGERDSLPRLLKSLEDVEGLRWVRLLYAYPDHVSHSLLETMAQSDKIVPYLDIPFQHASSHVLKAMGREKHKKTPVDLVAHIRSHMPQIALRTSLMVGFPGETSGDFQQLLDLVEAARFDHVGTFAFSPERGTRAARMDGQIPETIKEERLDMLMRHQRDISRKRLNERFGDRLQVMVEGYHPETDYLLIGRASIQAPEVDGAVIITRGQAEIGEIRAARVTGAHDYDLVVELEPPAEEL